MERYIPEKCFPWADLFISTEIDVVKVGEVGVNLGHPVRLSQDNSADIKQRQPTAHERPVLHPRNHVMQGP